MLGLIASMLYSEDWYVSNAGGMALEPAFSRFALRNKYALSVGSASFSDLPERLQQYYDPSYRIELRRLYEKGAISRRQWSFRDDAENALLAAVFEDNGSGFIERYNADKLIAESHQIAADGSDYITYYYYNRGFLIRAETLLYTPFTPEPEEEGEGEEPVVKQEGEGKEEPVWTDYYHYNRSYAIRSVERRFLNVPGEPAFFRSPTLIIGLAAEGEFVKPGSVFSSEFFEDVIINSGDRILYTTDDRGRILSEVRRDENDEVLGEVINTWSGDRLASVLWKSEDEERLIEYEYNSGGDRIFERNFRDGVLERTVRRSGEREVEELYMNGAAVLRAIWEDGRKVSEERIRQNDVRSKEAQ
ncbi:hypothetical protein AGMMS4952_08630 [Spirochaetia bacterium]|nr:hypothetical protein AGMMS4952_08630 [Spirochaetia bacterium]